ncbi:MAG: ribosome maturation factor RimM [Chloroflexota bacterium]
MPLPPEWLVIGKVVAAFGTHGELRVLPQTDFPRRFAAGASVFLERDERSFTIVQSRLQNGQYVLRLAGVDDRDQAEDLRGRYMRVPGQNLAPLEEGEYYLFQIMGLAVRTDEGRELGVVSDILQTGANDVYVVRSDSGEVLLPAIKDVIKQVDLDAGRLTVHVLPGLLPEGTSDADGEGRVDGDGAESGQPGKPARARRKKVRCRPLRGNGRVP